MESGVLGHAPEDLCYNAVKMAVMSTSSAHPDGGSADSEVKQVLRRNSKPFVTASEVADALSISRQYAHDRLSDLEETDEIKRQQVGAKAVVWWIDS